jgi:hypothetical protein
VIPEIVDDLAGGQLIRVLPDWSLPMLSVDALMAPRTAQPAKVRAALAAITTYLGRTGAASFGAQRRASRRRPGVDGPKGMGPVAGRPGRSAPSLLTSLPEDP